MELDPTMLAFLINKITILTKIRENILKLNKLYELLS